MRYAILILCLLAGLGVHAQTRLVVNVGTAANDGTGDSVRTGFQKANTNFALLWNSVYTNGVSGGGTNYTFNTNHFTLSGTNVSLATNRYLTNNVTVQGASTYGINYNDLNAAYIDAQILEVGGVQTSYYDGGTTTIRGVTNIFLLTPAMTAGTITNGFALVATNVTTGAVEFRPADALTLSNGETLLKANLRAWTQSQAYTLTSATYDSDAVLSSATVAWPDGSTGTYTRVTKNAVFFLVDAFTITHAVTGKTVTQSAVTRDDNGNITAQPALTIAP